MSKCSYRSTLKYTNQRDRSTLKCTNQTLFSTVTQCENIDKIKMKIRKIADLVDWHSQAHTLELDNLFYRKFGKLVEQKIDEFEKHKDIVKCSIAEFVSGSKVSTPRTKANIRPATFLNQKIYALKNRALQDSDDFADNSNGTFIVEESSLVMNSVRDNLQELDSDQLALTPQEPAHRKLTHKLVHQKLISQKATHTKQNFVSLHQGKTQASNSVQRNYQKPKNFDSTFYRFKKVEGIREKGEHALRQKEALLRIKAERVKREREERLKRVEKLKLQKELEERERQNEIIQREKAVKHFIAEQRKLVSNTPRTNVIYYSTPKVPCITTAVSTSSTLITPVAKKITQIPKNIEQTPENIEQTPENIEQTPENIEQTPENIEQTPENIEQTPQNNSKTYDMTADKVLQPSTEYDYNVDDLSSGDETDEEDNPKKTIPKWALKEAMLDWTGLIANYLQDSDRIERHFGHIKQPEIVALFPKTKKRFDPRNSSAIWDSPLENPTPGESNFERIIANKK